MFGSVWFCVFFFFKQKTAYEIRLSLVGSEMCIRDRWDASRIAFHPYQFRSATKRMVKEMKVTRMEGDSSFLAGLSPEHVADDLLDYELVKVALEKVGGLAEFDGAYNDFEREEVIEV